MRQIRWGVFETNSSSVHTMTICSKKSYDEWNQKGLIWTGEILNGDLELITYDQARERMVMEHYGTGDALPDDSTEFEVYFNEWLADRFWRAGTPDNYWNEYLDYFEETFVTRSGDEIVVFGQYGYDG